MGDALEAALPLTAALPTMPDTHTQQAQPKRRHKDQDNDCDLPLDNKYALFYVINPCTYR